MTALKVIELDAPNIRISNGLPLNQTSKSSTFELSFKDGDICPEKQDIFLSQGCSFAYISVEAHFQRHYIFQPFLDDIPYTLTRLFILDPKADRHICLEISNCYSFIDCCSYLGAYLDLSILNSLVNNLKNPILASFWPMDDDEHGRQQVGYIDATQAPISN